MNRERLRTAVALSVFGIVFLALVVGSYRLESGTLDEPQHLVAGYTALTLRDYRIDPEHPPFLRIWAALPLLVTGNVKLDTDSPDWQAGQQWRFAHQFLYRDNDADRLLFRARFMIALLGVLLGVLVFCWAQELFGFWPAVVVLGFYCVEPNILAHSGLVTTDLGATCFIFGAVYFAWRLRRKFTAVNVAGLAVFFTLAQISKFSAVLLVPVLLILLPNKGRVALAGILVVSYLAIWGVYGFRHAPGPGLFQMSDAARQRLPVVSRVIQWIDDHRLLPNAYAQGFTSMAARAQRRPAYFLGETSAEGFRWYFPVAFLIKTPITLLAAVVAGVWLCRRQWKDAAFLGLPAAVYFGAAVAGNLNIGLRHILPVYPFALLATGWAVAWLMPRKWVLAVLCAALVTEVALVYPHCLAFFNVAVGGPRHGAKYLVDSNLDWGQGLKLLKRWMTANNVRHINLSYFGNADPGYYGIEYTPLPGAPFFDLDRITEPLLPGYVAVSATNLRGAYLTGAMKEFYAPLRARPPVAVLGYSIYVYRVDAPWWPQPIR